MPDAAPKLPKALMALSTGFFSAADSLWRRGLLAWLEVVKHWHLERNQHFLWLPVFYGFGTGIAFTSFPSNPSIALISFVFAAFLLMVLGIKWQIPGAMLACVILLGLGTVQLRVLIVDAPILPVKSLSAAFTGQVLSAQLTPKGPRVVLAPVSLSPSRSGLEGRPLPTKVRLLLPKDMNVPQPGVWLSGNARLLSPPLPAVPGDYDFARVAYFQGLGAVGYSYGQPSVLHQPSEELWSHLTWLDQARQNWQRMWNGLRWQVAEKIKAQLPAQQAGLAIALSVGDRGYLTWEQVTALRQAGLAHLLAISGLHLGLVAGSLFFVIRALLALVPPLALHYPIKKWAAGAAWLGAFLYFGLSGGALPTERAFIMVSLSLLAIMIDRRAISLRVLAWAALLVLFLRPESLLTASFQLSFAAVTLMVAAFEIWQKWDRGRRAARDLDQLTWLGRMGHSFTAFLLALAASSLLAGLATAPFVLFHFQRLASFGLLANMIAIPLASFLIMPLILLTLFLMPFGWEGATLPFLGYCLDLVLALSQEISSWPGAVQRYGALPLWGMLVCLTAGLWLCLWQQRWRYWALPLFFVLPLSMALHRGSDVLASSQERLWAVRSPEGALLLPSDAKTSFSAQQWVERSGLEPMYLKPNGSLLLQEDGKVWGRCDPLGCRFRFQSGGDSWLALVLDPLALMQDCRNTQALLSFYAVGKRCEHGGAHVLAQSRDLRKMGGLSIRFRDGQWRYKAVKDELKSAPWLVNR